ncbi:MAG TPA: hypothetical protein PKY77_20845 [Phycisphaerae bacterium]|nr:hypothetical protein [Phycisphaerae bacterium]
MKKAAFVLSMLLAVIAGAIGAWAFIPRPKPIPAAQPAPAPAAEAPAERVAPPPPGFALRPASHDFGKLFEGEARVVELAIERPAGSALRLGRLYSPCPCIRVEAAPLLFEAGKPASVNVRVHSLTLDGKKSFPVYVEVLEPAKGVLRADVTVNVERVPAKIMIAPEAFHLGSAKPGKTASVKLTNLTKYPMAVQELSSSLAGSSVEMKGAKSLAPGEAGEIILSLGTGDLPPGPVRGEVTIKTDSALHGLVKIPVDGTKSN